MTLLLVSLLLVATPQPARERVITTVHNARLRSAPSLTAPVLREMPLGEVLAVDAREDGWLRLDVLTQKGYVREDLTAPMTDATRAAVVERIVAARLEQASIGFDEANVLVRLAGSGASGARDRETAARFALYELRALRAAADAAGRAFRSAFAFRLADRSEVFVNHEPAGQWILRRDYILSVHDRFADTAAADDIAWFMVENSVPGECEGYVPCAVTVLDLLTGEYLRRHPAGRHVDAAAGRIVAWLDFRGGKPDMKDYGLTSAGTACREAAEPLASLQKALGDIPPTVAGRALAALEPIAAACRGR